MLKLVTENPDASFFMDEAPIGRNGLSAEVNTSFLMYKIRTDTRRYTIQDSSL